MQYKPKDHYFKKAKSLKYPARSVFKLKEIDTKYGLIKPGMSVLDLGSSPGSWFMYATQRAGGNGLVVGIDLKLPDREAVKGAAMFEGESFDSVEVSLENLNGYFIHHDIEDIDLEKLKEVFGFFHVVLSDMAPKTTGTKLVDQQNSYTLAKKALSITDRLLKEGGSFLVKIFQGNYLKDFCRAVGDRFVDCRTIRPSATRKESFEVFILGLRKRRQA